MIYLGGIIGGRGGSTSSVDLVPVPAGAIAAYERQVAAKEMIIIAAIKAKTNFFMVFLFTLLFNS